MTRLPVPRLFADPPLAGRLPVQVKVSPGGARVSFLRPALDDRERLDLWGWDAATEQVAELVNARDFAEGVLTEAERAERERRRQFAGGITSYSWHPDGQRLLLTAGGQALLHDLDRGATTPVTSPDSRQTGITLSRTGKYVSSVRAGDLYVHDLGTGRERRLTDDGGGTVTNGLPEFIAQEEMHRFEGHWWSPDDRFLAYTRVDATPVPESRRPELAADGIDAVTQRYPYAGGPNATVRLALIPIGADGTPGDPRWIPWDADGHAYLARVAFAPSGNLVLQRQTRDQASLALTLYDTAAGTLRTLFEESAATWVNLHDNLVFTGEADTFVWTSERSGSADLYRFDGDLEALPTGLDRVARIVGIHAGAVVVTGWRDDPTAQHVYRIPARQPAAGGAERLTEGDAWHDAAMDRSGALCAVTRTDPQTPGRLDALDLATSRRRPILRGDVDGTHPYHPFLDHHEAPRFGSIVAEDGQRLHYRLTLPRNAGNGDRHPVIVHVYGGPGVQRVRREWGPLPLQLFAQRGFGVFELDNRGGAGRAKRFEDTLHGRLGDTELTDQLAGVRFLRGLDWVDIDRIGVFGHSYGGYMALLCLARAPGTFAAGVSVAPVTDWRLYDTHYTERYLGSPRAHPERYLESSVFPYLDGLSAPLLLMHGMADDNVLFTHTTKLLAVLQQRGVPFELMTYPGARHGLQEQGVAVHRYLTILDFFERRLA